MSWNKLNWPPERPFWALTLRQSNSLNVVSVPNLFLFGYFLFPLFHFSMTTLLQLGISLPINFDGHDATPPFDVPCAMLHVKCSKCLNSRARLHIGKKWRINANRLFEALGWTGCTFMDSLPHLGRSNNPSLNTDKKDFESPVIKGEIALMSTIWPLVPHMLDFSIR